MQNILNIWILNRYQCLSYTNPIIKRKFFLNVQRIYTGNLQKRIQTFRKPEKMINSTRNSLKLLVKFHFLCQKDRNKKIWTISWSASMWKMGTRTMLWQYKLKTTLESNFTNPTQLTMPALGPPNPLLSIHSRQTLARGYKETRTRCSLQHCW